MECGYSPKQIAILSFGSPVPALPGKVVVENLSLGKNTAAGRSCSLPYHRHYSPPPTKLPLNALYRHAVEQVCDRRRKWHRTGWLLASAGYVSPCCKLCLWYMCFCAEVFFSVLYGYKAIISGFATVRTLLLLLCALLPIFVLFSYLSKIFTSADQHSAQTTHFLEKRTLCLPLPAVYIPETDKYSCLHSNR